MWKINYWTNDGSQKGLILLFLLGIGSLAFSRFSYGVRNSYEVVRNSARYFEKKTCSSQNWGNGPKIGSSEFIEKFGRYFFSEFGLQ